MSHCRRSQPAPSSRVRARDTVVRLAAGQHGVVTRRQLLGAGLTARVVDRLVRTGGLRTVHRGVYEVGPVSPPRATLMAAVLACGPSATLSHQSAAGLWEILPPRSTPPVHVTIRRGNRQPPDVRLHRSRTLLAEEVTVRDGIPVTVPSRTLLDLAAAGARPRTLERALAEALSRRHLTLDHVRATLARHRGRSGSSRLRAVLDDGPPALTRSEAEERFLALIRKAGAPPAETNVRVGDLEVDFFWPAERLVVEVDGFSYHGSRRAFERDRRRDAELAALGLRVVRVTWRQLERTPEALLFALGRAFGR